MKGKEEYQHIIDRLRRVKEQTDISFREISDRTMENGEYVSESTIKKIFSPHDPHSHNYEKTIKPIARVLIGDIDEDIYPRAASYAAINEYKDEVIRQLRLQVSQYKEQIALLNRQKEESSAKNKKREDALLDIIVFQQDQIKRFSTNVDRKDATIAKLVLGDKG